MRLIARCALLALLALVNRAWAAETTLTIGITQYPATFHPAIEAMMAKTYVLAMTRRPLVVYDAGWKLACLLCTRLPTIENGLAKAETTPEGKPGVAVTFTIQPRAAWGDGVPVTTSDVLFSWKIGRDAQSAYTGAEEYRRIYKIDTIDAKTFTIHIDRLTFDYNALGSFVVLPAHIERANAAAPAEYRHRTAYDRDTTNPGLYFGPYRIESVEPGSRVTLVRNKTWWGAKPYFERISVRVIPNTAALEANLLAGGIDMISGELGLTVDQAVAIERRHKRRFDVIFKPGMIYEHLDLNLDNPILADKRVRQAMLMALDRGAISSQLFGGRQPVAHSSVNPLDWAFDPAIKTYAHDAKGAARLLAAAG